LKWRLGGLGGALYRPDAVDPAASLFAERIVGAFEFAGALGGSASTRPGITVLDAAGAVGAGLRYTSEGALDASVAILGGVALEHYSVEHVAAGQRRGVLWDPVFSLPVTLGWRLWRGFSAGMRLEPGFIAHTYVHTYDRELLWRRSAFRLQGGVWIGIDFF
jgi:hypothetical protein